MIFAVTYAFDLMTDSDLPISSDRRNKFSTHVLKIEKTLRLRERIVPFFNSIQYNNAINRECCNFFTIGHVSTNISSQQCCTFFVTIFTKFSNLKWMYGFCVLLTAKLHYLSKQRKLKGKQSTHGS